MGFDRYRLIRLLSLALLIASLSACFAPISSVHPIGPLSSASTAPELAGTWVLAPKQPSGCNVTVRRAQLYLHIFPDAVPDSRKIEMLANVISEDPPMESAWISAEGYVIRLKNGPFVNLRVANMGPPENLADNEFAFDWLKGKYLFAFYQMDQTAASASLQVSFLSPDDLKGSSAPRVRDSVLTASSIELAVYLSSLTNTDLFGRRCVFRKVG